MPTTKMPGKSKCGAPMKLLPTSTVAAVTKAIAAMRNMAGWKSTGIRSFSAIPRQIQREFERIHAVTRLSRLVEVPERFSPSCVSFFDLFGISLLQVYGRRRLEFVDQTAELLVEHLDT